MCTHGIKIFSTKLQGFRPPSIVGDITGFKTSCWVCELKVCFQDVALVSANFSTFLEIVVMVCYRL